MKKDYFLFKSGRYKMKYDLDLSKAYVDELENIELSDLDDEQMKTFLFECFCDDDIVAKIWQSIEDNYFSGSPHNVWKCIDFDSQWLDARWWDGNYPEVHIYLDDNITLEVNVNIFFDVDWNVNRGEYDAYCYHNYKAVAIHIENIKII
jgi:hypothetical protein